MDILQFDLVENAAVVQCQWSLVQAGRTGTVLESGLQTIRTPFTSADGSIDAGIVALRKSIDELSAFLAERLADQY